MRLIDADSLIKHFEEIQEQEGAIGLDFVAIIDEINKKSGQHYSFKSEEHTMRIFQDYVAAV